VQADKMLHFKLSAANSARIPLGDAEGFTLFLHQELDAKFGHEQNKVFRTARVRTAHAGREENDMRSRRISSTHAWSGRQSKSETTRVVVWNFVWGHQGPMSLVSWPLFWHSGVLSSSASQHPAKRLL
jgi:hypothetical protein